MMKKFLSNIVLFALAFFVVEKVFYVFLHTAPSMEHDTRLEQIIQGNMHKELLVMGSSRGARNIIAGQIADSLNTSAYNLSYPGSSILFHDFLLNSILKYNPAPKTILLAVDDELELLPSEALTFRLDRLYPLSKYNYINNELIKQGEKSFLSHFLVLARIHRENFRLQPKGISHLDTLLTCGSMPIPFQRRDRGFSYVDDKKYPIKEELPEKIEAFQAFQDTCLAHNIQLYLICSPNFKAHDLDFEQRLRQLSRPAVSMYVYDRSNAAYQNKDFFYDESHLQTKGARIFTDEVITFLKAQARAN